MQKKELSLAHLEVGTKILSTEAETPYSDIVAIYLATPAQLIQYRTNPSVLDELKIQASEMSVDDAADIVSFFVVASSKFMQKVMPNEYSKIVKSKNK